MGLLSWLFGSKPKSASKPLRSMTVSVSPEKNRLMQKCFKKAFFEILEGTGDFTIQELDNMYAVVEGLKEGYINRGGWVKPIYERFVEKREGWHWTESPGTADLNDPIEAKEVLDSLNVADLKAVLAACGIKPSAKDKKQDLIKKLTAVGALEEIMAIFPVVKTKTEQIKNSNKYKMYERLMRWVCDKARVYEDIINYQELGVTQVKWGGRCSVYHGAYESHTGSMVGKKFKLEEGLYDPEVKRKILPAERPGCGCSLRAVFPEIGQK